jgi:hypothetical protein
VSRVLVVASDLMARERIRSVAERLGMEISFARPGEHGDLEGFDVVVLDLDEIGAEVAEAMTPTGPRVLGYYSHVDVALGEAAERAGIRAVRRGRFWSDLGSYLTT